VQLESPIARNDDLPSTPVDDEIVFLNTKVGGYAAVDAVRRTLSEFALLACAWVLLALARVVLGVVPFRVIARTIGLREGRTADRVDQAGEARAVRIGLAVRGAASRTPWQSTCLMQALTAASLLRFSHIEATLYLGVAKEGRAADGLIAHAWLRCGSVTLTGEAGRDRFSKLASFAVG
jgi:hypothetical protein